MILYGVKIRFFRYVNEDKSKTLDIHNDWEPIVEGAKLQFVTNIKFIAIAYNYDELIL